jgi:hypothetical protein
MGPVVGLCRPGYHVEMAEEYRNENFYGHINLLGVSEVVEPISTGPGLGGTRHSPDWPTNRPAAAAARAMGGIVCEAHGLGPRENGVAPANVVLGLADVLDQIDPPYYYKFLDCGLRIGLGDGSDHPARIAGSARCYVRVEGGFSYRAWLEGLRAGRSFVTSGPLLDLRVEGRGPGAVLSLRPGDPLAIELRARSREALGTLEIVTTGGRVLASLRTADREAVLRWSGEVEGPAWFCGRASAVLHDGRTEAERFSPIKTAEPDYAARPGIAHTSAAYLEVEGRRPVDPAACRFWIERLRLHREATSREALFLAEGQRAQALAEVDEGIAAYERLAATAER